jgi:hypothetical protein
MSAGISGNVVLDNNGDREPDYWISDMDPTTGIFVKIAEVLNTDSGARVSHYNVLCLHKRSAKQKCNCRNSAKSQPVITKCDLTIS